MSPSLSRIIGSAVGALASVVPSSQIPAERPDPGASAMSAPAAAAVRSSATSGGEPSLISFDVSQRALFLDRSRVVVVCWHRQKGKDFTAAAKAIDDALETGRDWFIISLTQRQADATFAKCRRVATAFKEMLRIQGEVSLGESAFEAFDKSLNQSFVFTAREIRLPNGARVVSLPGRDPDTLAGLTGNVIFTEFGLFPGGGYDHWRVVFPLSTRGFQVIVISTPRAKNTKFFELCSDRETYSVHFCDIVQSVEREGFVLRDNQGQPTTVERFRKLYGDESGWQREYLCQFTGDAESLLKWSQLLSASVELGREPGKLDFRLARVQGGNGWRDDVVDNLPRGGRLEIGWDVARNDDISAVWCNDALPGRPKELRILVLMENTEYATQRKIIQACMGARGYGAVGAGDATGLGGSDNEALSSQFGDRWESVKFSVKSKSEMASLARSTYGDSGQRLPPADGETKFIHTDLYALQVHEAGGQVGGAGGDKRLMLDATENELMPKSHCDIAYANLLALRAGVRRVLNPLPPPLLVKPRWAR